MRIAKRWMGLLAVCLVTGLGIACVKADGPTGKDAHGKYRILVDKVMQSDGHRSDADWRTQAWMVQAAAEAGFTLFCPRVGFDRDDEIRQIARWSVQYNMRSLAWMRGTLPVPADAMAASAGRRIVWASGREQPVYSINAPQVWDWMEANLTRLATISVEQPGLAGAIVDFENYYPGPRDDSILYHLSYDDVILKMFASAKGVALPELPFKQRKAWLEANGHHQAFEQFQFDHWRSRTIALRAKIDAINPRFQIFMYPSYHSRFIVEAFARYMGSADAPVVIADAETFGPDSVYVDQQATLADRTSKFRSSMQRTRAAAGMDHLRFIGGMDPILPGADPEYCAKMALRVSELSEGYWVFYEGPTLASTHADYMTWFKWANAAMDAADYAKAQSPRQTRASWFHATRGVERLPDVQATSSQGADVWEATTFRFDNMLVVQGSAGKPVMLKAKPNVLGQNRADLYWSAVDAQGMAVASGRIASNKVGQITFIPKKDGVYSIGMSAGYSSYELIESNVPVGVYTTTGPKSTGRDVSILRQASPMYFWVGDGVAFFTVNLACQPGEPVKLAILDDQGQMVASGQTTMQRAKVQIRVPVQSERSGKVWSVVISQTDLGEVEDFGFSFGEEVLGIVSPSAKSVFRFKP